MASGELKTQKTKVSVKQFIDAIDDEKRRGDCRRLVEIMTDATGVQPVMWGPSIVGFGDYQYEAAAGRMNDFFITGFSPRKTALTVYLSTGYAKYADLLKNLGKHKTGGSCLYIKNLDDVDQEVLRKLIKTGVKDMPKQVKKADRVSTKGS
jgi:hypothetical protein